MKLKSPVKRRPAVERSSVGRARAKLVDWLGRGDATGSELLPSERILATTLGLHRGTLRLAIKLVEAEGQLVREGRRLVTPASASKSSGAWLENSIAVLVPPLDVSNASLRPWTRYVTLGATDAVRAAGHHAITLNASALTEKDLSPLVQARPMGVLLPEVPQGVELILNAAAVFARAGIPVVVYGDDPALSHYDRISSDHDAGSYELTRRLLDMGRRPARCWSRPWKTWWLSDRCIGYARAMTQAGQSPLPIIDLPPHAIPTDDRERFDYVCRQFMGFLMPVLRGKKPVDALMVTSDRDAFYVAGAVKLLGLEPGRDVVIAGYDNFHHLCEERHFAPVPALTVDKHNERMGQEMLNLLRARIEGTLPAGPERVKVAPELVSIQARSVVS